MTNRRKRGAAAQLRREEAQRIRIAQKAKELPAESIPLTFQFRLGVPFHDLLQIKLAEERGDHTMRKKVRRAVERYIQGGLEGKLRGVVDEQISGAIESIQWAGFMEGGEEKPGGLTGLAEEMPSVKGLRGSSGS